MGNWDKVIGQDRLKEYFMRAAERSQISHAYILEGGPGTPGMELAEAFARMLQCERGTGCGLCRACRLFDGQNHPDVIRIIHEKPAVISVKEIREQLVDPMTIRPYYGPYKIYLVEEAEKMTVQAQNALLKTLEEPPSYGVIFLITVNAEKLLTTIRSRSVCLKLADTGRGIELLSGEERDMVLSVLKRAQDCGRVELAGAASRWKESGISTGVLLNLVRVWFRDILVWKELGEESQLALRERVRDVREAAERYSYPAVQEILKLTDRTERRISSNGNYELAMELLLAKMRVPAIQEATEETEW